MANTLNREQRAEAARLHMSELAAHGVRLVAITMVDNAGITRVKTFPLARLEHAAAWGIGLSPVFGAFLVDDSIAAGSPVASPTGDLRLLLDPNALHVLAAQPGWAWAPADQYTQDGDVFAGCQRSCLARMVDRAADYGLVISAGTEIEWFLGNEDEDGNVEPAHHGPAYSFNATAALSEYVRDLIEAFDDSGVEIAQFHPEYATGQLELSLPVADAVTAADLVVLAQQTIRAISSGHGWHASFAPVVVLDTVGNGGHVHLSARRDGSNVFAGGDGPHGLTADGGAFVTGVVAHLPALVAVGAPSAASYLRLQPSRWAGAYACWGHENREAAVRLVTGSAGEHAEMANVEVKCFDQSANPYLAIGCTVAAGLDGIAIGATLAAEITVDPASLGAGAPARLPQTLDAATDALETDAVIAEAMGPLLFDSFVAARRAEADVFRDSEPDTIAAGHRWRY